MKNITYNKEASVQRQKAEKLLKKKKINSGSLLLENDKLKLIHELEVHQIELELQYEEVVLARSVAQEAAEKYTDLYDFAPSGYFTLSSSGEILELNLRGAKMLGKERSHLEKSRFGFFVSNDTKQIYNLFLSKVFNSTTSQSCEVTLITDDNIPVYVLLKGIQTKDSEQCHITIVDITVHKMAEEALEKSEALYRAILNASPDNITITDLAGRIVMVSPVALKMLGFDKKEDLIGRMVTDIIISANPKHTSSKPVVMFEQILFGQGEYLGLNKDGTTFNIEVRVEFIRDAKEQPTQMVFVIRDITESKLIKQELIAAKEKAEESDRLKSAFLANMSHEIRTPMNGILGFTQLLKKPDLTEEKQQQYISMIEKGGVRMLNLINDLIDISKIESGLTDMFISNYCLNEQITDIYTFFKPEIEKKGMQIFYNNNLSDEQAFIKTDREKVYAILTNLVKNALKYSDKGTIEFGYKLKVKNRNGLDASFEPVKNADTVELLFYVKDTGIGIPVEKQKAIFDRFIQADITDKRAFQGAGLGLSISKAYVEMLGGSIWVESLPGKGSTFFFTLPYIVEKAEEIVTPKIDAGNPDDTLFKKLTVLIAEDDELSALLQTEIVRTYCKKILYVSTGVDAVEICRNNTDIDLVLMDIQMPRMDGYEATRQIRKFNPDIPIIAQTAYTLKGEREKAIMAGCTEYISKPVNLPFMIALVKNQMKK